MLSYDNFLTRNPDSALYWVCSMHHWQIDWVQLESHSISSCRILKAKKLYQIMDKKDDKNSKSDRLEEKYNNGNDADGIIDHLMKLDGVSHMLGTDKTSTHNEVV